MLDKGQISNYEKEYTYDESNDCLAGYYFGISYDSEYCKLYKQCKLIVDRIRNTSMPLSHTGEELKYNINMEKTTERKCIR